MALALFKDKQFGVKLEAAAGVEETLTAADYGLELTELSTATDVGLIDQETFRGSISSTPSRIGKKTATVTIGGEMKTSGILNTLPRLDPILQAARMLRYDVKVMAVTGLTGTAGVVKGKSVMTSSTKQGVILDISGNDIYYAAIAGTFAASDVLTVAGTAFAATVASISATNDGFFYMPSSSAASEKTLTVDVNDGGIRKVARGVVADLSFSLTADSYPSFSGTLTGVLDEAKWGIAATDITGITFEDNLPPVVNNAHLRVNNTVAPLTQTVDISLGNNLFVIPDLNSDGWLKYGVVTKRASTGSLNIYAIDPAVYSVYSDLFAGQVAQLVFTIGSTSGNMITVFAPACQFTGVSESDDNGFLAQSIDLKLTGIDNEVNFWYH